VLADKARPDRRVVEQVTKLRLDDAGLLLDDEDLFEAVGEREQPGRLDRIRQADLVEPHAASPSASSEMSRRRNTSSRSKVRLAAGDDADRCVRRLTTARSIELIRANARTASSFACRRSSILSDGRSGQR
jgi:hypothetical protein